MKEFKFLFNKLPFYVIFYPTSRCNARCPHCFNYKRQDKATVKKELSLDEIENVSRNFGHIKVLTITGGEPFLRDDLTEIVSIFHKNNGVQYVSFHTNAFLPDRVRNTISRVLDKFADIQVIVCISIDGIGKVHDRFRNVENGFEKILETIAKLKELRATHRNLNLISSTIFSHSTVDLFSGTIRFIQNNIGGIKPSISFIRGRVMDKSEKAVDSTKYQEFYRNFKYRADNSISPFSPMAFKEALEMVVNKIVVNNCKFKKQTVRCQSGRKLIVIYENGDVYPCETMEDKFGNLREVNYDVKKLLFSERGQKIIKKIQQNSTCYCTWENIIPVNLLFNPMYYPRILYQWFHLFVLKNKQN